jgi:hypothetical protein
MRVLVACEFSGVIREAFNRRGHDAWSCDLLPTEIPGKHIQGDVLDILGDGWDLMIAHPPCTYLCRHRSRWNKPEDEAARTEALEFFMCLLQAPIGRVCIENPIPLKKSMMPPYSQIVQPWQFGHDYSKATCLWLRGLPPLKPTNVVEVTYYTTPNGRRFTYGWYKTPRNWRARSRTFPGIAEAMAVQWGWAGLDW